MKNLKNENHWEMEPNVVFTIIMVGIIWLLFYLNGITLDWWQTVTIIPLVFPYRVGNTIYSLFGGINKKGSVNCILSMYSKAQKDAFSMINIYQKAGHNTMSICGSIYQHAKEEAANFFLFSLFQKGEYITIIFGIAFFQKAKTLNYGSVISIFSVYEELDSVTSILIFKKKRKRNNE